MLKPEIKIGETTIELPCALKDIENIIIDEEEIYEYNYDGIDVLSVRIYRGGSLTAFVSLDNRDKDLPIEEKTIVKISLYNNTEIYGIRKYESTWEDACEIVGKPGSKIYGNFLVPLEGGYYLECLKLDKTVADITVYRVFDSAESFKDVH